MYDKDTIIRDGELDNMVDMENEEDVNTVEEEEEEGEEEGNENGDRDEE